MKGHASLPSREDLTAAVHFVQFELSRVQIDPFRTSPVVVAITHPEYKERTVLESATRASLLEDLLG